MNARNYARKVMKQHYIDTMKWTLDGEDEYVEEMGEHSPFYDAVMDGDADTAFEIFLEYILPDDGTEIEAIYEQMAEDGIDSESPEYAEIERIVEDYLFYSNNTSGESEKLFDECFREIVAEYAN